jgi:hypothetical protein
MIGPVARWAFYVVSGWGLPPGRVGRFTRGDAISSSRLELKESKYELAR